MRKGFHCGQEETKPIAATASIDGECLDGNSGVTAKTVPAISSKPGKAKTVNFLVVCAPLEREAEGGTPAKTVLSDLPVGTNTGTIMDAAE